MKFKEIKEKLLKRQKDYEEDYQRLLKKLNEEGFVKRIYWDFGELFKYDFLRKEIGNYIKAIQELETKGEMKANEALDFWIEILQDKILGNEFFSPNYSNNSSGITLPTITLKLDCNIELLKFFKFIKKFGI